MATEVHLPMSEMITAGFIGCGSHARRNVFPALQFAPIKLQATCDLDTARAEECARQFGAQRAYASHEEMLEKEDLDAVFIVTNYDERGRPKYPPLAMDCMRASCDVWIEKPPASSVAEIQEMQRVSDERSDGEEGGEGFALLRFASGAVGTMHFASPQSGTSPLERVEAIGQGANVVIDNGVKLTYYRPSSRGPGGYGRATSYIGDDDTAPIYWEPEFSLGQLYNKALFLLGYAQEVSYFAECVLAGERPTMCGLDYALEVTKLYEALLQPEGQIVSL